jgi:hypothetical protein
MRINDIFVDNMEIDFLCLRYTWIDTMHNSRCRSGKWANCRHKREIKQPRSRVSTKRVIRELDDWFAVGFHRRCSWTSVLN